MGRKIDLLGLKKQYSAIKREIDSAVFRVINSGFYIGGHEVDIFEKKAAKFLKVKYAISVNSGTDALFLALKSLGIKNGDEVITTPFTFIATAEVIANLGAKPIFADIDPETFNIDVKEIKKKINSKTKAIIPVHLFGQPAEMKKIKVLAKKYNLFVIEDSAQSFGAKLGKKMAGTVGDFGCFSFFPSKNLGCFGDGGMIVTNNKRLAEKVKLLKNHGSSSEEKYLNLICGFNSRLDSIQAAILSEKIKHITDWNKTRKKIAKYYNDRLEDIKRISTPRFNGDHIFNQYTVRAQKRDSLKQFLLKKSIFLKIYYPLPLHLQPAFKNLKHKAGDFPVAERASKEVISLPIYPEMERSDQDLIIREIKNFYKLK